MMMEAAVQTSGFVGEVYSQPNALIETAHAIADQLETLDFGKAERRLFTGMGSSAAAVYPSLLRLNAGGVDAHAIEASELLYYRADALTASTGLIFISQSGRSAEIAPLLDLATARHLSVLGITNTPGSPLHERSNAALVMRAGEEATVSTKTYTCTLATLHLLTTALLGEDISAAVEEIEQVANALRSHLGGWQEQMNALAERWETTTFVEYLARGYSTASATTAALISKESIKMPTEGMNAGQFRHGPLELVDERFTGMLFLGDERARQVNLTLARDIVRLGGQLVILSPTDPEIAGATWTALPDCPPALLPLAEIIPVQFFCAAMSVRRGYEAGQFRYISKVTTQE